MNTDTLSLHEYHSGLFRQYCTIRDIPFSPLIEFSSGANNRLYRSHLNERTVIVKIGTNPHFRRLFTEFTVLESLHGSRKGAVDYYVDNVSGTELLVMPRKPGTHRFTLSNDDLSALGKTIASYHYPVRTLSGLPHETALSFVNNFLLPVPLQPCNATYTDQFTLLVLQTKSLLAAKHDPMMITSPVLVHGDLIPLNILFTARNKVSIIDWEGARIDSPEADLATCIKAFRLNEEQQQQFLQAYGHPLDPVQLKVRSLVHYLQVVAWRLAIELPLSQETNQVERVEKEIEEELQYAERVLQELC